MKVFNGNVAKKTEKGWWTRNLIRTEAVQERGSSFKPIIWGGTPDNKTSLHLLKVLSLLTTIGPTIPSTFAFWMASKLKGEID